MPAPTAASRHRLRLLSIQTATIAAMQRVWRRMEPRGDWRAQYRDEVGPRLVALAVASQVAATTEANQYVPDVLAELDFDPVDVSVPRLAFAGYSGDGRPVDTLLEQSMFVAARSFDLANSTPEAVLRVPEFDVDAALADALADAERWVAMVAGTIIADTNRAAESAALTANESVEGYVRMLNPPSCSRCVILAGRFYRWNDGFERHPRCDCVHIPASEADLADLRVNPGLYFDSLSREEQDQIFTKAGAQAVRDGADLHQVVNARRGMNTAQQNPRGWIPKGNLVRDDLGLFVTTEGTTVRGLANATRRGRNAVRRLMPESIYELARDRDDAIRLLRLHGFIL
jgi:hypothetical protein